MVLLAALSRSRNWEGWSPDDYLTGVASYLTVKHAQEQGW